MLAFCSLPIYAIHIPDGVLDWPWLAIGFLITSCLAFIATYRIRDEEIPRIALLSAAFFVASSIHIRLGPTSVHLLLNGLVGVLLGWRAPLAILIGILLQAVLISHGGITTIGVNAAVTMIPALAAAACFPWLSRLSTSPWPRGALVMTGTLIWGSLIIFSINLFRINSWHEVLQVTSGSGLMLAFEKVSPALEPLLHPFTLVGLLLLGVIVWLIDRRLQQPPEFAAGAIIGSLAVVTTTLLNGLVLVSDGIDRWNTFAMAVLVVHLPLALLEGLILGVILVFLSRVKGELVQSRTTQMEQVAG